MGSFIEVWSNKSNAIIPTIKDRRVVVGLTERGKRLVEIINGCGPAATTTIIRDQNGNPTSEEISLKSLKRILFGTMMSLRDLGLTPQQTSTALGLPINQSASRKSEVQIPTK